ncbi:hypothetical protein AVEN_103906-1 [Araneus ventricosus]|uniref:Uncharacterized protein n=1 Tax=Araneus ventricosus TaxID=182803 RepID=A0A4Y2CJM3_ARAVE|nr:hypothetical protein AVEN_103906-1 [Araneus ventricosus]
MRDPPSEQITIPSAICRPDPRPETMIERRSQQSHQSRRPDSMEETFLVIITLEPNWRFRRWPSIILISYWCTSFKPLFFYFLFTLGFCDPSPLLLHYSRYLPSRATLLHSSEKTHSIQSPPATIASLSFKLQMPPLF